MNFKTKIDDFGRMVTPKKIRDELGIKKDSQISLISKEDEIIIRIDNTDKPFIQDQGGVLVVCSESAGPLEEVIKDNRDERIKKTLGDIDI